MSKKYCFKINNPTDATFNVSELKEFVQGLYTGDGDLQFKGNEKVPFVVIYAEEEANVCISMTSVGQKNNEFILWDILENYKYIGKVFYKVSV